MYVRRGISIRHVLRDSWFLLTVAFGLSVLVYLLHSIFGFDALELPALPVTTIGIVVSLYLGFQSNAAYLRWWEARGIWGEIVNSSRIWAGHCLSFLDVPDDPCGPPAQAARKLILQHLAWINALAFQLRANSRLKLSKRPGTFASRVDTTSFLSTSTDRQYRSWLSAEDVPRIVCMNNPAVHILRLQGETLRLLRQQGVLDSYRFVELSNVLARLYDCQGQSERIKNTPFPRQYAYFGRLFTWLLIVLMPFAFVDAFSRLAEHYPVIATVRNDYLFILIPFSMLISWIFYVLQRVSESCEDPFEGGATDVPISTLTRVVEIDLLQMLGDEDIPAQYQPLDGVLY